MNRREKFASKKRAELSALIKTNIAEMNRRISELRKEGDAAANKWVEKEYSKFKALTKTASKTKLATGLSRKVNGKTVNMKKADMVILLEQMEYFLASPWSTKEGREELIKKSYETFKTRYKANKDLEFSEYLNIREFFGALAENKIFREMAERNGFGSESIKEIGKEGYSKEWVLDIISKYDWNKMNISPKDFNRFLSFNEENPEYIDLISEVVENGKIKKFDLVDFEFYKEKIDEIRGSDKYRAASNREEYLLNKLLE